MNARRALLLILSGISLLGISSLVYRYFFAITEPNVEDVQNLFQLLSESDTYAYATEAYLEVGNELREYYVLFGERSGDNSHINGTVLGTDVELYLVDDVLYQRVGDQPWRVSPAPHLEGALSLVEELDPASAFSFSGVSGFTYLGISQLDDEQAYMVELIPEQTGWVDEYFTDIKYTVWISVRGNELLKSQLSATLKEDPNSRLILNMELYDIGSPISITAPSEALPPEDVPPQEDVPSQEEEPVPEEVL